MTFAGDDRAATRVFDLIDAGKLGSAEGVLETSLLKYPDSHALLAAETLLLLKLKQFDKAKEKAVALSRQEVTDGKAVNALVHVLQQSCLWDDLARTYERVKHLQNEQSVMENLVHTYVRMGAFDKAQKTAIQLYRQWNQPRYLVWSVQANLAQVPPDVSDDLLLKLSAKLLDTTILTEKGLISPSTARMYVDVLHQQRNYIEALTYLTSARGAAVGLRETRLELLVTTLCNSDAKAKANAVAKYLWTSRPDNWLYVEMYLNTLVESDLAEGVFTLESSDKSECVQVDFATRDTTLDDALLFCRELIARTEAMCDSTEGKRHRPCRGPFMAELEILSRQGNTAAQQQQVALAYAQRFYRNACCYLDLSTYLDTTSAASIYAWSVSDEDPSLHSEGALGRHARRLLGLRCRVALWGETAAQQPSPTEAAELFDMCRAAYEEARPLSVDLAWSEEGHCDGYITVCLNIALHVFHATQDTQWPVKALELLNGVDRKMNNPTWLMYTVCFARVLGLADVAAWRQLAFKSVQHDTMSHLGYWPLITGGAVEELCLWNEQAWEHYQSLPKDCSMLRSKVFAFTSWPAMRDVQEFERRQMSSMARTICSIHRIVAALRQCQTQRNVFDLMQIEARTIAEAHTALATPQCDTFVDNTDWTSVYPLVLGNIHETKVRTLIETLVGMPSREVRLDHARRLVWGLMLLHDVAMLEEYRVRRVNAPKPRKEKKRSAGKGSVAANDAESHSAPPELLLGDARDEENAAALPAMAAITPSLLAFVRSRGEWVVPHSPSLREALDSTITPDTTATFLFPEAILLIALLQVGTVSKLPIVAWAKDVHAALQRAKETCAAPLVGVWVKKLQEEKTSRMGELLSDLMREALAAERRR